MGGGKGCNGNCWWRVLRTLQKVKVLSRSAEEYTRERPSDLAPMPRNFQPQLHPFEEAREYVRALNATKLDKVRPLRLYLTGTVWL